MNIHEFIAALEPELDDLAPGTLQPDTVFTEIEEWSSLYGLIITAWVSTEMDVELQTEDISQIKTVSDLYNIVMSKRATDGNI